MLILIVDDEALVRTLLKRILADSGYGIIEAASGEEAVQILKTAGDTFDLVLTDLKMPGMHGTALAQFIREQFPSIPILFMSGYSDELSMLLAADDFIEKPFKRHILLKKVQAACTRRLKDMKAPAASSGAAKSAGASQSGSPATGINGGLEPSRRFSTTMGPLSRVSETEDTISRLMHIEWELARKRTR